MKNGKISTVLKLFCLIIFFQNFATASDSPISSNFVVVGSQSSGSVKMVPGMTFGNNTLSSTGDPTAVAAGTQYLKNLFSFQNQWSGGFGTNDPWPVQSQPIDWSSLDARINLILSTNGTPTITLCGVPQWMRLTPSDFFSAPAPAHYQDYANYAALIAKRYPQVKHFLVWSEMRGFWNSSLNRWNYEGYTQFYNNVYTALKGVSTDIQVGGPYVSMNNHYSADGGVLSSVSGAYGYIDQRAFDVITYWLQNKVGADFIAIDGSVQGNHAGNEDPIDWFAAVQFFSDADTWIQAHTTLPIWHAEYYSNPCMYDSCNVTAAENFDHDQQNALLTKALLAMTPTTSVALKWTPDGQNINPTTGQPEPYQTNTGPYANMGDQSSVWSDTSVAGGGQGFPFATSLAQYEQCFPLGAPLYPTQVVGKNISAYASAYCLVLINQTASAQTAQIALAFNPGQTPDAVYQSVQLAPYQVYYSKIAINLISSSQNLNQVPWTRSGVLVQGSSLNAPGADSDGSMSAQFLAETTANGQHLLQQTFVATPGQPYTFSISTNGQGRLLELVAFDSTDKNMPGTICNPATGAGTLTSQGSGWYRCAVTFTPTVSSVTVAMKLHNGTQWSYAGVTGQGLNLFGPQLELGSSASSYVPTGTAPANLLSGSSLNFASSPPWGVSNASVTGYSLPAPDGSLTADFLQEDLSTNQHLLNQLLTLTPGQNYLFSVYIQSPNRQVGIAVKGTAGSNLANVECDPTTVNLDLGFLTGGTLMAGSGSLQGVGAQWYRCSLAFQPTVASNQIFIKLLSGPSGSNWSYLGDGQSGAALWEPSLVVLP